MEPVGVGDYRSPKPEGREGPELAEILLSPSKSSNPIEFNNRKPTRNKMNAGGGWRTTHVFPTELFSPDRLPTVHVVRGSVKANSPLFCQVISLTTRSFYAVDEETNVQKQNTTYIK